MNIEAEDPVVERPHVKRSKFHEEMIVRTQQALINQAQAEKNKAEKKEIIFFFAERKAATKVQQYEALLRDIKRRAGNGHDNLYLEEYQRQFIDQLKTEHGFKVIAEEDEDDLYKVCWPAV